MRVAVSSGWLARNRFAARAQVAARDRNRVDGFRPHFFRQLLEVGDVEAPHVGGKLDGVEKRGVGHQPGKP